MLREAVRSSALASVGYDEQRSVMEIEFRDGTVYMYLDVSATTYEELMAAESKGNYLERRIRPNYRFLRVR